MNGDSLSSSKVLNHWRGNITLFDGFYATYPKGAVTEVTFKELGDLLAPDTGPEVSSSKAKSTYFIPCSLIKAELVGKTLANAISKGLPTIGVQRSSSHVTKTALLVFDLDDVGRTEFIKIVKNIKSQGLSFLVYSSFSYGDKSKPGISCRLIIPLDREVNSNEYRNACKSCNELLLKGLADQSGFALSQQQGIWATTFDRIIDGFPFKRTFIAGLLSVSNLLEISPIEDKTNNNSIGTLPVIFDQAKVRSALQCIDLSEYDDWMSAGLQLKAAYGDKAKHLWLECSRPGKYEPPAFWDELQPRMSQQAAAGLLFKRARDAALNTLSQPSKQEISSGGAVHAMAYLRTFHYRAYKHSLLGSVS